MKIKDSVFLVIQIKNTKALDVVVDSRQLINGVESNRREELFKCETKRNRSYIASRRCQVKVEVRFLISRAKIN